MKSFKSLVFIQCFTAVFDISWAKKCHIVLFILLLQTCTMHFLNVICAATAAVLKEGHFLSSMYYVYVQDV